MAGIIDKIGQYFAQLELEQQRAVALAVSQSPTPPSASVAGHRDLDRGSRRSAAVSGTDIARTRCSPSVIRRRLSLQVSDQRQQQAAILETVKLSEGTEVPPLTRSVDHAWDDYDSISDDNSEDLASWRSLASPPVTGNRSDSGSTQGATETSIEETEHLKRGEGRRIKSRVSARVAPRKKKLKKRRSPSSASLARQAADEERERNERIANGLARAQERARRIQEETQQQARERMQARRDAVEKIKAQLERIEEVRAQRSGAFGSTATSCGFSLSKGSSSAVSLELSEASDSLPSQSASSRADAQESDTADNSVLCEPNGGNSQDIPQRPNDSALETQASFLAELEARTRLQVGWLGQICAWQKWLELTMLPLAWQMLQQLQFRKQYLDMKKRHERLHHQFERTLEANAGKHERVASLKQDRDAVEKQLSRVVEELAAVRKQRHELEEVGRNERLRRQKEAERALQRRLREEEWAKLMSEEKLRAVVAARAREKAGERVQRARWAAEKLYAADGGRQLLPQKPRRRDSGDLTFVASIAPETNETSEEELLSFAIDECQGDDGLAFEAMKPPSNQEAEPQPFEWLVPPYNRHEALLLTDMVSDDDDDAQSEVAEPSIASCYA